MKKMVAQVKFEGGLGNPFGSNSVSSKIYNFLTNIEDLQAGDKVVVDTVNGLSIAVFVGYSHEHQEFGETFANKKPRWIIQKIDTAAHEARLAAQEELEKVKKMMEVRRKAAAELEIYEILAKQDPEMQGLLDSYKKLQEVL